MIDVTLVPLRSKTEAERALQDAQKLLKQDALAAFKEEGPDGSEEDDEVETSTIDSQDGVGQEKEPEDESGALEPPKSGVLQKGTSFVKNVVQDKGKYGRFATKWFSRTGSQEVVRRQQGLPRGDLTTEQEKSVDEALPGPEAERDGNQKETHTSQAKAIDHLTPRILKSARLYFSSSGFYFSYEHDISGSLAQKMRHGSAMPMWKRFDELFFWNQHLLKPFIHAGLDDFVLPLMQGFVGQRAFTILRTEGTDKDAAEDAGDAIKAQRSNDNLEVSTEEKEEAKHDFLLTLISRRSVKRAGLRYLRRGIDDDGAVANNVETEQILSTQSWEDSGKTFSLLQSRGSIPLFFSQSPYSFKPVPVMFGSEATNQGAFRKHISSMAARYGDIQIASLVDKHGTEAAIGKAYQKHAETLNNIGGIDGEKVGFEWFDFHGQCKGMRFENVQVLMDSLQGQLKSFGWIAKQNDRNVRLQRGVLRTNCMDCLDRTNVVQSAVAGWALQQQLEELGLKIDLKTDAETQWFNTLWADNGDAISKQYAGTSALKGDFTRTRKRNWTGALSDFSLTLNRYYNNIFGDYFLQTNIDYFLGNAGPSVFDDFETDMMSQDYALDMRHVRQHAIDTCIKIVLEDPEEELLAGWTLTCPGQSNTLRAQPFEECVLLLTDSALYFCRFDWQTEKIGSFERVELLDVKEMWRGTYITSALGGTHLDESKNVGFAVRYESKGPTAVRTNTRSLSVTGETQHLESPNDENKEISVPRNEVGDIRLLAFKALPPKAAAARDEDIDLGSVSEKEMVRHVCETIHGAMVKAWKRDRGFQHLELDRAPEVEARDLISVAEAKKSTGYIESLGYSLKRLVWS